MNEKEWNVVILDTSFSYKAVERDNSKQND